MPTYAENLVILRDRYMAELLAGDIKPNYSIRGQSVSWSEYRAKLLADVFVLDQQIATAEGPVEIMSEGIT